MSHEAAAVTDSDLSLLRRNLDQLMLVPTKFQLPDSRIVVQMQLSRPAYLMPDRSYRATVDILQIGWAPFVYGEEERTGWPKSGARSVWKEIETFASGIGRAVRVVTVLQQQLSNYLKKKRAYVEQPGFPQSLLWIPPATVGAGCRTYDVIPRDRWTIDQNVPHCALDGKAQK